MPSSKAINQSVKCDSVYCDKCNIYVFEKMAMSKDKAEKLATRLARGKEICLKCNEQNVLILKSRAKAFLQNWGLRMQPKTYPDV